MIRATPARESSSQQKAIQMGILFSVLQAEGTFQQESSYQSKKTTHKKKLLQKLTLPTQHSHNTSEHFPYAMRNDKHYSQTLFS